MAVIDKTYQPDPQTGKVYKKYKEIYKEFLVTMRDSFSKIPTGT
jgi:hypothetical protein